jgi:Fe(3+) dicitrate transport protein
VGDFENYAAEARLLSEYDLGDNTSYFLIGSKYYNSNNSQRQGPGSASSVADFDFADGQFPNYPRQSNFDFPNENLAFFSENLFQVTDKFSLTPGVRFEYIKTQSEGTYKNIILDLAGNPLLNETLSDNRKFERSFVLLGLGSSYKFSKDAELYANFSQNYRSVTFNDIRVTNPVFQVDPNITDEEGFTADLGLRGRVNNDLLTYDVNVFGLRYRQRIGEILKPEERVNAQGDLEETGRIIRFRGNIGDSFVYGLETFGNLNLRKVIAPTAYDYKANVFFNGSFTDSEYTDSDQNNVEGNEVEFIPKINLKTGINFGYKNLLGSLQYTYLSKQFTDATNAPQDKSESQRGIEGAIPAYGILDLSFSYKYKFLKLETGINNILDNRYFTRRATGYPGPGIIPAKPLTWYTTLQVKL